MTAITFANARSHMVSMIPAWVDGVLTPVEKLDVHKRGLRHPAVSVFLFCGSEVLLQRRAMGKYHSAGLWANTCCTHPAWDEAPEDCALRRLAEELGIEGVDIHHRGQVEYRADVLGGLIEHEVVEVFAGQMTKDHPIALNPKEVMEVAWWDIDALCADIAKTPDRYSAWLRIYLRDHAQMILGAG